MGNIKEESIAHIWEKGDIFNDIRDNVPLKMKGVCGDCLFRLHCLGFCRADVLFDKGSVRDSHVLCQMLFDKGLFPESRILSREVSHGIGRDRV